MTRGFCHPWTSQTKTYGLEPVAAVKCLARSCDKIDEIRDSRPCFFSLKARQDVSMTSVDGDGHRQKYSVISLSLIHI